MIVKRFAVYPGYVSSRNDWDRHYISAQQLMDLYRVRPAECIVIRDDLPPTRRTSGWRDEDLDRLLALRPQTGLDYVPVTEAERARYPLDLDAPDPPGTLAIERRLLGDR